MASRTDNKSAQQWWSALSAGQRKAVVGLGGLEFVLTAATLRDLARRPRSEIRGSKALWLLASAVQPLGPMAYLAFGRRNRPVKPG